MAQMICQNSGQPSFPKVLRLARVIQPSNVAVYQNAIRSFKNFGISQDQSHMCNQRGNIVNRVALKSWILGMGYTLRQVIIVLQIKQNIRGLIQRIYNQCPLRSNVSLHNASFDNFVMYVVKISINLGHKQFDLLDFAI